MSHRPHGHAAPHVRVALLTLSDTRTPETDRSGALLRERFAEAGHDVVSQAILREDPAAVRAAVEGLLGADIDAIVMTGGTGISPRDRTHEAVEGLIDTHIPGFGELFRMLSYEEVGPAAMFSRAFAGVARGIVLVALPGSEAAVRLATDKLLLPGLAEMVGLLSPRP